MSHSHKDGHGRCSSCGDDGAVRRLREEVARRIDEQLEECEAELPDPSPPWATETEHVVGTVFARSSGSGEDGLETDAEFRERIKRSLKVP